jgi:hypothetical protein
MALLSGVVPYPLDSWPAPPAAARWPGQYAAASAGRLEERPRRDRPDFLSSAPRARDGNLATRRDARCWPGHQPGKTIMPESAKAGVSPIVPDAGYYRTKAAQFLRLAELPHAHHDRETLLELAIKLQAMADAMDNEPLSAAELLEILPAR